MARVVVVGGGFAGLAAAARLARRRHDVTVLEASEEPGGAAGCFAADGHVWDTGPGPVLLPAVPRDLFRKTGAPLEDEVDLLLLALAREHRFADGTVLRLPTGSRAAQRDAGESLGPGLGQQWCGHVDAFAATWETLRGELFERPWDADLAAPAARALIGSRRSLHRHLRATLADERLRLVAAHPFVAAGLDPRRVPAWAGLRGYLEQTFGSWAVPGGTWQLTAALERRCAALGVVLRRGTGVRDLVVRAGRATGVATTAGEVDADAVVVAVDPRRLPALARHVARTAPAMPPTTMHLALGGAGTLPDLPAETVLHGDPVLVVRTGGTAPAGRASWTVHARGRDPGDLVAALAAAGIDLRDQLVQAHRSTPEEQLRRWRGSPLGVQWRGRGTVARRVGPDTPVAGAYACGAHSAHLPGLPFAAMTATLVAEQLGRA